MDEKNREKWYYKTYFLILMFLCIGPLALPLFWANPRYSKTNKIVSSVIVIILTYFLVAAMMKSTKAIFNAYNMVGY